MTGAALDVAVGLAQGLLALALLAALGRLLAGPSVADRIVGLDVMAGTIVAACVTYALGTGLAVFVDVALAIALITFLGTVVLARGLERGGGE